MFEHLLVTAITISVTCTIILLIIRAIYVAKIAVTGTHRRLHPPTEYQRAIERDPSIEYSQAFLQPDTKSARVMCVHKWRSTKQPAKAICVYVHGLASYGVFCASHVPLLVANGFTVIAPDHRGHGSSDGVHCFFTSVEVLVEDLWFAIKSSREDGLPVFLMGSSLGGLVSLKLSLDERTASVIKGVVALAPAVVPNPASVPSCAVVWVARVLCAMFPELPLAHVGKGKGYTDLEAEIRDKKHPHHYLGPTRVGVGMALLRGMRSLSLQLHQITTPLLVIHGDQDKLCHLSGSQRLVDEASSRDKQLLVYPGVNHVLLREPNGMSDRIIMDASAWMTQRLK